MRDRLKSMAGWLFVLAFLALPNCALDSSGGAASTFFDPGAHPNSGAIFCDIEDINTARQCVLPADFPLALSRQHAAVDLVSGSASNTALDFSQAAIAAQGCSPGQVVLITYLSPFPTGAETCLNCGQIGVDTTYPSADAACVAKCKDMNGDGSGFCSSEHAHASTNAGSCFAGMCTDPGSPLPGVAGPLRQSTEAVVWDLPAGGAVSTSGADANTLTRDAATTQPAPGAFDKGAASSQTITKGDGYVVFTATETESARVCGLSTGSSDSDQSDQDIAFGIRLSAGGHVLISENGSLVVPPDANPNFWFADYVSGDRFRVTVTANPDGSTANIEYFQIPSSCAKATCIGTKLRPADGDPPITASYPFRVDASLREQNATLTDVRIVRIK